MWYTKLNCLESWTARRAVRTWHELWTDVVEWHFHEHGHYHCSHIWCFLRAEGRSLIMHFCGKVVKYLVLLQVWALSELPLANIGIMRGGHWVTTWVAYPLHEIGSDQQYWEWSGASICAPSQTTQWIIQDHKVVTKFINKLTHLIN